MLLGGAEIFNHSPCDRVEECRTGCDSLDVQGVTGWTASRPHAPVVLVPETRASLQYALPTTSK